MMDETVMKEPEASLRAGDNRLYLNGHFQIGAQDNTI